MASDAQDTTENVATESQSSSEAGTLGFSNAASVAGIFPQRNIQLGSYDPETEYFALLNSSVSNGHGFSEDVNLNYENAPDGTISSDVVGPPANAYVPNPSSPGGTIGVTNDNPADMPAAPASFVSMNGFGGATGGGPSMIDSSGNPLTPSATAAEISNSSKSPGTTGESAWTNSQALNSQTPSPGIGSTS